jgi:ketopantoate hydroxymethyltransferase
MTRSAAAPWTRLPWRPLFATSRRVGAQAVKLEGGRPVVPQVEAMVAAGIPVMGHLGLTPQSVNALGGYRVQGRGPAGDELLADALALQDAGLAGHGRFDPWPAAPL